MCIHQFIVLNDGNTSLFTRMDLSCTTRLSGTCLWVALSRAWLEQCDSSTIDISLAQK